MGSASSRNDDDYEEYKYRQYGNRVVHCIDNRQESIKGYVSALPTGDGEYHNDKDYPNLHGHIGEDPRTFPCCTEVYTSSNAQTTNESTSPRYITDRMSNTHGYCAGCLVELVRNRKCSPSLQLFIASHGKSERNNGGSELLRQYKDGFADGEVNKKDTFIEVADVSTEKIRASCEKVERPIVERSESNVINNHVNQRHRKSSVCRYNPPPRHLTGEHDAIPEARNIPKEDREFRIQSGRVDEHATESCQNYVRAPKLPYSLGSVIYDKLGLQSSTIRKELVKRRILGNETVQEVNTDVILREFRHAGLVKPTYAACSYKVEICADAVLRSPPAHISRLQRLGNDDLGSRLEKKLTRHTSQMEKNNRERQEKVQKFKERQKSAKVRRSHQIAAGNMNIAMKMMDTQIL